MTAPPMPPGMTAAPPPMPPGPMGAPPLPPTAPPVVGGALSPVAVNKSQQKVADQSAYLAARRAADASYQGMSPAAGVAALPPTPPVPLASGAPPPAPLAPPPGLGLPTPAPAAPLPAMAEGGQIGGQQSLDPPGVTLLPGVVPAPVLFAAMLDRMGGSNHLQRFATGGMVSPELMAMVQGGTGGQASELGIGSNGMGAGGGNAPIGSDVLPGNSESALVDSNALTPDEQAQLDTESAGPPAPKSFEKWVESGKALASDDEFDQEVYQAAQAEPDKLGAVFRIARGVVKADPSQGSPDLKKALGLPTGQPTIQQSLIADREERAMR